MSNVVSSSVANISLNKVSGVGNYAQTINKNSSNVNLNKQNITAEEYDFSSTIELNEYERYKIQLEQWTKLFQSTLDTEKEKLFNLNESYNIFIYSDGLDGLLKDEFGRIYIPDELRKDVIQLQPYIDNYGEIEGKERFYKWIDEEYAPLFDEHLKEAIGMTYEEYLAEKSTLESSVLELSGAYYALRQEQKVLPYLELQESTEYQAWLANRENNMPKITMERNSFLGDKIYVNGVEIDPRNIDPMLLGYAIDKGYITHNSVHKGMSNIVDASDYYYLTQDQRNMYSYIYETQGSERAEAYKTAIEDSINQAKAIEEVNAIMESCTVDGKLNYDSLTYLALEGIEDGVKTFGEGLINIFNDEGIISANQYSQMYLLNTITNSKDTYLNEIITDIYNKRGSTYAETFYKNIYNQKTGEINLEYAKAYLTESQYKELESRIASDNSVFYSGAYELGSAFGNMLPSMVLAYITKGASLTVGASTEVAGIIASVAGNVTMGISSAGNAYNQALIQGNRRDTSYVYGMLSGLSETTLGMLLGNIPGLNTDAAFSLKGILSEGLEEGLQTYVDAALTSVILGEPVNLNDCHGEALKGAIYGMILSGTTTGVQTTYKVAVGSQYANLSYNNLLDFYKLLNTSNMSIQTDNNGNTTFVIEGNEKVQQDTIDKIKSIFPGMEIVQKYNDGTISRPLTEINQTEKNNIFLDSNNENSPKIIPVDTSMKNDALNALTDEEFFNLIKLEINEYPRTTIEGRVRDYGKVIKILGKGNIVRYFNENFSEQMHPNIRETILTELSTRIARYNEALNYNEIQQIFNEVLQNIIKEQNLGKENFSSTFILKYQEYFLPDNVPLELKNLYYNKLLTYEDIVKYYNYFGSTNISCGFVEAVVRGKFDNTSFIKLLDACKGDINKFKELSYVKYFERSDQQYKISSYEDFLIELDNYYKENRIIFKELNILKELNFNNEYLNDIENNIKKSGISEKHLYNTDVRIFSNNIIERFGFDVIRSIVEYRNSGAMELFIKYASNEQYSYKLITWFNYLNKNNLLDSKMINYAILSFESCSQLVDKLLENGYILDENQKENLRSILINKNEFGVSNISELTDYIEYKKNQLSNKLNSEDMTDVKNAILQVLFGLSWDETKGYSGLIDKYNLNNKEFFETYVSSSTYITPEIKEAIQLIIEICNSKDLVALKRKFENIIKLGNMRVNKELLYESLTAVYSEIWNQQLFRYDENINGIKISFVDGVDGTICTMDVNGRHISSEDKIQVIELDGEKFKLIIHGISPKIGADTSLGNISKQLIDNPSLWNKLEGSTTISTSLISEKHLAVFGESDQQVVYYGFNNLPVDVLKGTSQSDSGTMHGGGQLDAISGATKIMTPNILLELSAVDRYNEVVLMRKSNIDTEKNEGRVQPNCIICFNGYISDASKLAAQYFDVPIYMINKNNYDVINQNNKNTYESGNITKFDNEDIENILLSNIIGDKKSRQDLCFELCNKALTDGIINKQEYYDRINYIKKIIEQNNISRENIYKKILDILSQPDYTLTNIITNLGDKKGRQALISFMVNRDLKYIPEEYRSQIENIPNSEIKSFLNPDKSNIGTQFFGEQSDDLNRNVSTEKIARIKKKNDRFSLEEFYGAADGEAAIIFMTENQVVNLKCGMHAQGLRDAISGIYDIELTNKIQLGSINETMYESLLDNNIYARLVSGHDLCLMLPDKISRKQYEVFKAYINKHGETLKEISRSIDPTGDGVLYFWNNTLGDEVITHDLQDAVKYAETLIDDSIKLPDEKNVIGYTFADMKETANNTLTNIITNLGDKKGRQALISFMVNRDLKYIPEEYRSQIENVPNSEIKSFLNPDKSNIGTQFFGGLQSNDIDVINQIQIAMNTVNTAKGQNVAFSQLYQYLRTGNKLMLSREGNFRNIIASLDYNKVAKYYDLIQKGFNNQTSEVERDIIKIMELHNEVKERVGYEADYGLLKFINPYDRNYGRYEAISSNKGAREILQKYTPAQVAAVLKKIGYNIGNIPVDNTVFNYNNSINNNVNGMSNVSKYITRISKNQLYDNIHYFISEFVNGKKKGQSAYSTLIRLNCPIKSEPSTDVYRSFMDRFLNITTQQASWNHIHTPLFDINSVNHRLYINADYDITYKFLELFANKCENLGIEYYFKTSNNPTGIALLRSESAVIYAPEEMIIKYAQICQEIKREHPELQFYSPPVATAAIDGWLGYGAEPSLKTKHKLNNEGIKSVSFNVARAHIIDKAISRGILDFVNKFGDNVITNGKTTNQLYIDSLYLSIVEKYNITDSNNTNALYQHLLKYSDYYINCLKQNGVFSVGNYTASTESANTYMYNYISNYRETDNFIMQEIKSISIEYGIDPDNFAINISN